MTDDRFNERLSPEDLADLATEVSTSNAISAIRQQVKPIEASEFCLNCGEPTGGKRWCDQDCRQDWESRQ